MARPASLLAWTSLVLLCGWCGGVWALFGHPEATGAGPLGEGSSLERHWNYWHCSQRLALHERPLAALHEALFQGYPHFGNTLDFWLLAWPLERVALWPAWFNLQAPLVICLNGLAATWSLAGVVSRLPVAAAGGILFGLNPWTLELLRAGSIREAFMVFPVLVAGAVVRLTDRPAPGPALLAGVLLGLSGAFYWFYGVFGALLIASGWLAGALARRAPWGRLRGALPAPPRPGLLLLVAATALLTAWPFAAPFLPLIGASHEVTWGVPLPTPAQLRQLPREQTLAVPTWHGLTTGSLQNLFHDCLLPDWPWSPARRGGQPGWLWALALAGLALQPRRGGLWALWGGLFYVLSLGPHLQTAEGPYPDEASPWPLPYSLLFTWVPPFSRLFHPDRCALYAVLAQIALAALALEATLQRRPGARSLPLTLPLLVLAAWGASLSLRPGPPPPLWDPPAFYVELQREELQRGERAGPRSLGALIEAPVQHRMQALREGPGVYQILHGRQVLSENEPGRLGADPLFRWLARPLGPPVGDPARLRLAGVEYVILHELGFHRLDPQPARRYEEARDALGRFLEVAPREERETVPPPVQPAGRPDLRRGRVAIFRVGGEPAARPR